MEIDVKGSNKAIMVLVKTDDKANIECSGCFG